MSNLIAWVMANAADLFNIATALIAAAAAITAMTPSPRDDGFVAAVRNVLNKLALNVGNAKNASDVK